MAAKPICDLPQYHSMIGAGEDRGKTTLSHSIRWKCCFAKARPYLCPRFETVDLDKKFVEMKASLQCMMSVSKMCKMRNKSVSYRDHVQSLRPRRNRDVRQLLCPEKLLDCNAQPEQVAVSTTCD